jgi:alpha-1,2-mannosyltransferase
LLLFLPWLLLTRRWRALACAVAVLGGVVALGIVLAGSAPYRLWIESLGQVGWWWLPMNASWQGVVSRFFEGGRTVEPVYSWPALVHPLSLAGNACIALVTLGAAVRAESHGRSLDFTLLTVLLGGILASPLGWVYYLPLALGPVVALFWTGAWRVLTSRWLVASGVSALALWIPLEQASAGQPSPLATMALACSYFVGTAVPWLTLTVNAARRS